MSIRRQRFVPLLCALGLCLTAHSDAHGSAWLLRPGEMRTQIVYFQEIATEKFASGSDCFQCDPGEVIPLNPFNATSSFQSLSFTLGLGLPGALEIAASIPWVVSGLSDEQDAFFPIERTNRGVSDAWLFARKSMPAPFQAALVAKVKAPTGEFTFIDGTVPAGEGQWDIGAGLETGGSMLFLSYWLVEVEYRVRLEREATRQRPGNEWHAFLGGGIDLFRSPGFVITTSGFLSLMQGDDFEERGVVIPGTGRARATPWLSAALEWPRLSAVRLDLGYGRPVAGRNLPAGDQIFVSLQRRWLP